MRSDDAPKTGIDFAVRPPLGHMAGSSIRPARPGDAPAIQRIARAAWHAAYDEILSPETVEETVDAWYDTDRLVEDDLRDPDRPFLVAQPAGDPVGFVEAALAEKPGTWHLYRLYVHAEHWGEGVGTALLEALEADIVDRGVERLRVSVLAANDVGVGFYEARGFERLETRHDERFDVPRYEYEKAL